MSFPIVTNSGTAVQIGTGLLYSNVVYFPTWPYQNYGSRVVSWTVPTGVTTCRVRVWGGGGSGAAGIAGGGGGFVLKTITSLPAGTVTVTVGVGGNAGNNPGTGGTSSFGAYVTATGGRNNPSTGGAGSSGDINMNGSASTVAQIGGNAGNLFIPFTGVSGTEILHLGGSPEVALTIMGTPTNGLDKIGTGYLFGLPSTAVIGTQMNSLSTSTSPNIESFGNGVGGNSSIQGTGTYPGGGGANGGGGAGGLVIVEY